MVPEVTLNNINNYVKSKRLNIHRLRKDSNLEITIQIIIKSYYEIKNGITCSLSRIYLFGSI